MATYQSTMKTPTLNETCITFWGLGVLNNMAFVVMIASAKSISEGSTALVFLANIVPGLAIKLTSPYWFDKVSYTQRIKAATILSGVSFLVVSFYSHRQEMEQQMASSANDDDDDNYNSQKLGVNVVMQLIGVALCSAQGGLGEATFLALCGRVDSIITAKSDDHEANQIIRNDPMEEIVLKSENQSETKAGCMTAYASGTGVSGIGGFAFIFLFTKIFRLQLHQTLLVAIVFPILYWILYLKVSEYATMDITEVGEGTHGYKPGNSLEKSIKPTELQSLNTHLDEFTDHSSMQTSMLINNSEIPESPPHKTSRLVEETCEGSSNDVNTTRNTETITSSGIDDFSSLERFKLTLSLWPYMVPLFMVYFAEYALQSGVWTSIGFPVDDATARESFYVASNWTYQAGVFLSRSSGTFLNVSMTFLWFMPILQCVNLIFFYFVATDHFWYDYSLLLPCFFVGLLGGAVFVHGYIRINKDLPVTQREFALSTVSVADSFGIMFADIIGLFIQSCLYSANNLPGAAVTCPVSR